MGKLWGGRFGTQTHALMDRFQDSIRFDSRLARADIRGSQAYARALHRAGLLSAAEVEAIEHGLEQVLQEFETEAFLIVDTDEDIHTAVERRLFELVGPVAGKLHTGRSRNDQVATDTRLYVIEQIDLLSELLRGVQSAVLDRAEDCLDVIMPGYTHLQPAQPILFSHWLAAFFWMLQRDRERFADAQRRASVLPLGASALAGNGFPIDCESLASDLGFDEIARNSLDAVSDRDFVAEFLFAAALLQTHLSRLAEDLIMWSNPSFGFVEVAEQFATGSSIMPQKRNPDALELLRAKTGRLNGNLIAILTVLKGTPSSYNKDFQEDKEPLFDTVDTLSLVLPVTAGVISTMRIRPERMQEALDEGMLATELADYLVTKGVPFRESHHRVGEIVRLAEARGCALRALPLEAYQEIDQRFDQDLYHVLDHRHAVQRRRVPCGTSPDAVRSQIERARALLGRG